MTGAVTGEDGQREHMRWDLSLALHVHALNTLLLYHMQSDNFFLLILLPRPLHPTPPLTMP